MTVVQPGTDAKPAQTLFVQKKVLLDQTDLKSASVITNQPEGKPRIQITFTDAGAKRFAKVTYQNTSASDWQSSLMAGFIPPQRSSRKFGVAWSRSPGISAKRKRKTWLQK
jgi:hypothetical protein